MVGLWSSVAFETLEQDVYYLIRRASPQLLRTKLFHKLYPLKLSPQIEVLNKYLLLTSKPMIYLVNLSEKDYIRKKNKW